jgi:DNA-directed RNA polymerase sigma subunit (sigma70/sigma32)
MGSRSEPVEPESDEEILLDMRRRAGGTSKLGREEEARLLERSAQGDGQSRERLIAANLGMVLRLADDREAKGLSVPDLVQEGFLGMVEAVRTFDLSGEPDFSRYAEQKVAAQMDAAIAAEASAVREGELLVAAASDYERTELNLRRLLGRAATEAELAEKLEWTVDRTRYVAQVVADARRRHDEELLDYIDPDAIETDDTVDGE